LDAPLKKCVAGVYRDAMQGTFFTRRRGGAEKKKTVPPRAPRLRVNEVPRNSARNEIIS